MAVAQISREQHYQLLRTGQAAAQQQCVYNWIRLHPRCTRRDIAAGAGIDIAAVCGRVAELLELRIVAELGRTISASNGRSGAALVVAEDPQGQLF